jgi:DNA-binding transcriptional regulator YhcF (GntR family)
MKLKDKTYKKFVDYFEKMAKKHDEEVFEIAYSEIQRETGVASITLKKAIQIMENDGVIQVHPGRNTRYGRFRYLLNKKESNPKEIYTKSKDSVFNGDLSMNDIIPTVKKHVNYH